MEGCRDISHKYHMHWCNKVYKSSQMEKKAENRGVGGTAAGKGKEKECCSKEGKVRGKGGKLDLRGEEEHWCKRGRETERAGGGEAALHHHYCHHSREERLPPPSVAPLHRHSCTLTPAVNWAGCTRTGSLSVTCEQLKLQDEENPLFLIFIHHLQMF